MTGGIPSRFRGVLITDGYRAYQGLLPRIAGIQQCRAHVIRRCRAVLRLGPGSLQSWQERSSRSCARRTRPPRTPGRAATPPLTRKCSAGSWNGTTRPPPSGRSTTGSATGTRATHPGWALATWLQDFREQVLLFTRDFQPSSGRTMPQSAPSGRPSATRPSPATGHPRLLVPHPELPHLSGKPRDKRPRRHPFRHRGRAPDATAPRHITPANAHP